MNKTVEALKNGKVVKMNMSIDIFFKLANGIMFTASTNEKHTAWALSNATLDFFNDDNNFRIVNQ